MARAVKVWPAEQWVMLRDWRSRWDGVLQRCLTVPRLERSCSPGEVGVFTPTGETCEAIETYDTTTGQKQRTVTAAIYRRTSTRLHRLHARSEQTNVVPYTTPT